MYVLCVHPEPWHHCFHSPCRLNIPRILIKLLHCHNNHFSFLKELGKELQIAWQDFQVAIEDGNMFVAKQRSIKAQGLQENIQVSDGKSVVQ